MSCENLCLELRPKTTLSNAYICGKTVTNSRPQHENQPATVFVDEDCVDNRSDVDGLRTCDCLYGKSTRLSVYVSE